ncbi:MAG: flagellar hook capping protein [Epulopiscium sp. Nuni2H_MBin001]|nr:MAG: flagellar hook capping protein [Epulopiscium sp. Nuni2H_MBin001]
MSTISGNMVAYDSSTIQNNTTEVRDPDQDMGKDAFLQLLVTQLQYQDPMDPMDNSDMLAQLAQFTALEQMTNIATATEKQTALSMVGNTIEYSYNNPETGALEYLIGNVDYVKTYGSETLLGIGEHEITLDSVQQVINATNITGSSTAFDTLGKTVQAVIEASNLYGGTESTIVEGEVLEVRMIEGVPHIVLGTGDQELEVAFSDVQNIVDNPTVTGSWVEGSAYVDGEKIAVSGIAEYVYMQQHNTYLYIDGYMVNFNDVTSVKNT